MSLVACGESLLDCTGQRRSLCRQMRGLAAHCRLCRVLRSARPGPGDAASLARGMGSVEMLDAGDDQSATPTTNASSSGGASPWGSADKSSSSSLLSDATAFQVRTIRSKIFLFRP